MQNLIFELITVRIIHADFRIDVLFIEFAPLTLSEAYSSYRFYVTDSLARSFFKITIANTELRNR